MKAMLLAAGHGSRLKPLTDSVPKPLLTIGTETLIERHIKILGRAGFEEIIINVSYRRAQIMEKLGDGSRYGVHIFWSDEGDATLGTGGGIYHARALLGDDPWLIINADIYTDWLPKLLPMADETLAHLIMINNPAHCPDGDYNLLNGQISLGQHNKLTFSGIGCYKRQLFENITVPKFQLPEVLKPAIQKNLVQGTHYTGRWVDVGTPERLNQLRAEYQD